MWRDALAAGSAAIGVPLTDAQLHSFGLYLDTLLDWNQRINLTAITDPNEVAALHFLDSLTCLPAFSFDANACVLDVGSGAGFPGIPLAIARPDLKVTLLESVRKKRRFLEHVVASLDLPSVSVKCARAETAGRDPTMRDAFDVAVTRALAELSTAAELCLPLVKVGGIALVMKGPKADDEISRADDAIAILGGMLEFTRDFDLPTPSGSAQRVIIGLRKAGATPDKYPRAPGIPAKRPISIDRSKPCG